MLYAILTCSQRYTVNLVTAGETRRANHVQNKSYIIHHDLTFLDLSTQPTDRHAPLHITRYMQTQATQINQDTNLLKLNLFYAFFSFLKSSLFWCSALSQWIETPVCMWQDTYDISLATKRRGNLTEESREMQEKPSVGNTYVPGRLAELADYTGTCSQR